MTEGNVTSWKVEEGDSFSTGDLQAIKMDKAQMDVKAQDDGVVAKTIQDKDSKDPNKQTYPLYPSVQHLLHEIGLSTSEAEKIPASGPNGRLLKGDVLSYLGRIASSYSSDQSTRISKLGHLDLSNIRVAKQTPKAGAPPTEAATPSLAPEPEIHTEVTVPISLRSVTQAQKRIQDSLGVFLPLSTFIARAADIANDDLPRLKRAKPSTDELFNQVVGLDKVLSTSRGSFMPQIIALPRTPSPSLKQKQSSSADIIDILGGKAAPRMRSAKPVAGKMAEASSANNIFSVSVPKGEEKRARVFLDRVKNVLEAEPGRLVL
ncbi:MAG: pyridoxine biosynthesis protein [Candelina submexicana]|nr:MAG: pyridoxine biosynthesis protein [Candelina submexicana]